MGASGLGGDGKKSANAELNLVPYIDLLSTLICFLLLTAVYQQIAALSTQGSPPGASDTPSPPPDPNRVELAISLFLDRVEASAGPEILKIQNQGNGDPDYKSLLETLNKWKEKWPERKDVKLNTDGKVPYKHLIKAMDVLVEGEFDDVGVNTN